MSTRKQLQYGIYKIIDPLVRLLIKAGLTPNAVTTIGLVLNIGVAIIFIMGAEEGRRGDLSYVGWAGALILFAGLFDMLDGQVARLGNMSSRFGALYDSVLDRYSELILFLGICYYLVAHHYFLSSLFAFIALIGSMMVSYTRARAEGLGIECKDGLMQRPERVITIGLSAITCGLVWHWAGNFKYPVPGSDFPVFEAISVFTIPIVLMAFLTNITAIRRLQDAKKALSITDGPGSSLPPGKGMADSLTAAPENASGTPDARPSQGAGAAGAAGAPVPREAAASPGRPAARNVPPVAMWLLAFLLLAASLPVTAQTGRSTKESQAVKAIQPSSAYQPASPRVPTAPTIKDPQDTFPIPPHSRDLLFYLQRTPNSNTVLYELNIKDGIPDKEDPIHPIWIRYTENKQRQELSFIQRVFAYGVKARPIGNDKYELRFVSYKKHSFYLMRSDKDQKFYVFTTIANRTAMLNRIFIRINGGSFWSPNVEYIELKGIDADSGKEILERIKI